MPTMAIVSAINPSRCHLSTLQPSQCSSHWMVRWCGWSPHTPIDQCMGLCQQSHSTFHITLAPAQVKHVSPPLLAPSQRVSAYFLHSASIPTHLPHSLHAWWLIPSSVISITAASLWTWLGVDTLLVYKKKRYTVVSKANRCQVISDSE